MANDMVREFLRLTTQDACVEAKVPERRTISEEHVYTMAVGTEAILALNNVFKKASVRRVIDDELAKIAHEASIEMVRLSSKAFDKVNLSAQFYISKLFAWAALIAGASGAKMIKQSHLQVARTIADEARDLL